MAVTFNPFTGQLQLIDHGGGGGGISGSGASPQLTYWDTPTSVTGDSNFALDVPGLAINLGGFRIGVLGSAVINDNEPAPVTLFSIPHASYKHAVIEYSIERGTNFRTGTCIVVTDGTTAGLTDALTELPASTGVTLLAEVAGAVVEIRYTSTNTGDAGTFKYHVRKWL